MPLPKNRSGSMRRIYKRTPGGRAIHYKRKKKGKSHFCPITGQRLPGVSSQQGIAKSTKRPKRKFGGQLSSSISSRIITLASRIKEGAISLSDVEVRLQPYVKKLLSSG